MNYESGNKIKSFTDLYAWREAHKLVLMVYKATKNFPKDELFGIINQARRAAVSISSNIAEGFARFSYKEKAKFYIMAQASNTELQNQLLISKDVGYLSISEFNKIAQQSIMVHKLLNGLIKKSKDIHNS